MQYGILDWVKSLEFSQQSGTDVVFLVLTNVSW